MGEGWQTLTIAPLPAGGGQLVQNRHPARRRAGAPRARAGWIGRADKAGHDGRLRDDLERALGADDVTVREAGEVRKAQAAHLASQGAEIGGGISMLTGVAVFVGLFVVANTFGALIRQRTRRLALLAAIGRRPSRSRR